MPTCYNRELINEVYNQAVKEYISAVSYTFGEYTPKHDST